MNFTLISAFKDAQHQLPALVQPQPEPNEQRGASIRLNLQHKGISDQPENSKLAAYR